MEDRRVFLLAERLLAHEMLVNLNLVERPAVRLRHRMQLAPRFGQRDVERLLAGLHTFEQKLQRERRLAGAGVALDEIDVIFRKSTAEDRIESGDPRACHGFGTCLHYCPSNLHRWERTLQSLNLFRGSRYCPEISSLEAQRIELSVTHSPVLRRRYLADRHGRRAEDIAGKIRRREAVNRGLFRRDVHRSRSGNLADSLIDADG